MQTSCQKIVLAGEKLVPVVDAVVMEVMERVGIRVVME
jgi:hypothetical protein